jgi:DNA-binding CsgD family transcriptional regulator
VYTRMDRRLPLLLALALGSIVLGGTVDLLLDQPQVWLSFHVVFETLMIAGALTMASTLWLGWWRAERNVLRLHRSLEQGRAERARWQRNAREAIDGFGRAIDEQFRRWVLTPVESEVALLLLKGHSHKAIARMTGRSSATVRQHATAVYHKAELSGRAQLAAFFLEDLVLPSAVESVPQAASHPDTPGLHLYG